MYKHKQIFSFVIVGLLMMVFSAKADTNHSPALQATGYEAMHLSQTQAGTADGYFKTTAGQVIDFVIQIKNLRSTTWRNTAGTGQVILATSKTASRVSAPASTGYDDCFDGSPSPNCGMSYFYHSSWLTSFRPATAVESTISQNGTATFRFKLQIPSNAAVGRYIEGLTLYANIGTASNPNWQPVPNYTNGQNNFSYIWIPIEIQSATIATPTPTVASYQAEFSSQSYQGQTLTLGQSGKVPVEVKFKVIGSKTWYRTGTSRVYLKVKNPPDMHYCAGDPTEVPMVESSVAPNGIATFRFNLCGNNLPLGTINPAENYGLWSVEQNGFIVDLKSGDSNKLANVWWQVQIQPASYCLEFVQQSPTDPQTIQLPINGTAKGWVEFKSMCSDTPAESDLVLAIHKDANASTLSPVDAFGSSIFRNYPGTWINNFQLTGVTSSRIENGQKIYRFDFSLNGNNCAIKMSDTKTCTLNVIYREDMGVALKSSGMFLKRQNGQEANAWFGITMTTDYLAEFLRQSHSDVPLNPVQVPQKFSAMAAITFTNTGLVAWNKGDIWLEIKPSATNPFKCPTWQSDSRLVTFKENSVALGKTATFEFELCGNNQPIKAYTGSGTGYAINLGLRRTNGEWVKASAKGDSSGEAAGWFPLSVVLSEPYMGQFSWQSHPDAPVLHPAMLTSNGSVIVKAVLTNTGTATWLKDDVGLYVKNAVGTSKFQCPEWESQYRVVSFKESEVKPKQTATFEFKLCGNGQLPKKYTGRGTGYVESFGLGRRTGEWVAVSSGDGLTQVDIWFPISIVETSQPEAYFVKPRQGAYVSTNVDIQVEANAANNGVTKVVFTAMYDGAWHTLGEDTTWPYELAWNVDALTDQEITLGFDVYGTDGSIVHSAGKEVKIVKDSSGYQGSLVSVSPQLINIQAGRTVQVTIQIKNMGTKTWSSDPNNPEFVGLYADNPPTKDCQPGSDTSNGFRNFRFANTFASKSGNPLTGVARLTADVPPGGIGTFTFKATAKSLSVVQPIYLGLSRGPLWVSSLTAKTACDFHTRVTIPARIWKPIPKPRVVRRVGDPVDSVGGNYHYHQEDLHIEGRGLPLNFERTYDSAFLNESTLSYGWFHNYAVKLSYYDEMKMASVEYGNGQQETYYLQADGTFTADAGIYNRLTKNSDGSYILNRKDQSRYEFNSIGQLTKIIDRHGNSLSLSYSNDLLAQVTDDTNRSLTFSYTGSYTNSKLVRVVDPIGRQLNFSYNPQGQLVRFEDVRGKATTYSYNSAGLIETVTDANGQKFLENQYDSEGRVIWQRSVDNVTTFTYLPDQFKTIMRDGRGNDWTYLYDDHLRVVQECNPANQCTVNAFDAEDNLTSVQDGRGNRTYYEYDTRGNITKITDANGGITLHNYNSSNDRTSTTDSRGNVTSYSYNNGNLEQITAPSNTVTRLTYNPYGQVLSKQDANNALTTMSYDAWGYPQTITDPLGKTTRLVYDQVGRKLQETNGRGFVTKYSYDPAGHLLSVENALGYKTTYVYDAIGLNVSMMDAAGRTTQYSYDDKDQLIKVINPMGKSASYSYDPENNLIKQVNFGGETTYYAYDKANRLIETRNSLSETTLRSYDANGNLVSLTDANNHTTRYSYDNLNQVIAITDSRNGTTRYSYDAMGNRLQVIDANSKATRYEYDVFNRLIKVIDAANGIVEYSYDKLGNMLQLRDANGHVTTYQYDALSHLRFTNDALGQTETRYDEVGNKVWQKDAKGQLTTWQYDALNQLAQASYADQSMQYSYNQVGNITRMVDKSGTTTFEYDLLNRLSAVTTDLGTVRYGYDAMGRRQQLTYPNGQVASYSYNQAGHMTKVVDWTGGTTQYSYDNAGNLTQTTLPNGTTTVYEYDAANQIKAIRHTGANATPIATFGYEYDLVNNRTAATEWLVNTAQQTSTLALNTGWNLTALPVSSTTSLLASGLCATGVDQVVRRSNGQWNAHPCGLPVNQYPLNLTEGYFVRSNSAATVALTGTAISAITRTMTLQVGWNLVAPASTAMTDAEKLCQTIESLGGQATEVVRWFNGQWNSHPCKLPVNNFSLSYGQGYFVKVTTVGRDLLLTGSSGPLVNGVIRYQYDDLYRLKQVTYPSGETTSYSYDALGNRLKQVDGTGTTNYSYDGADRLLTAGNSTLSWDGNGNLIRKVQNGETTNYSFDSLNRLMSVNNTSFTYNGAGQRMSKTVNGQTTRYVQDMAVANEQVLVERTTAGDTLYLYGLGRIAKFTPDGKKAYYHTDSLGSVRAMSDATGKAVASYAYQDFGQANAQNNPADTFGFTGEQGDETGLTYLRARYYDPTLGRFMSKDTFAGHFGETQSLNRFVYVQNNPTRWVDPSGYEKDGAVKVPPAPGYEMAVKEAFGKVIEKEITWKYGVKAGKLAGRIVFWYGAIEAILTPDNLAYDDGSCGPDRLEQCPEENNDVVNHVVVKQKSNKMGFDKNDTNTSTPAIDPSDPSWSCYSVCAPTPEPSISTPTPTVGPVSGW